MFGVWIFVSGDTILSSSSGFSGDIPFLFLRPFYPFSKALEADDGLKKRG